MVRPSGEIAICAAYPVPPAAGPPNAVFSGGAIVNCAGTVDALSSALRRNAIAAVAIRAIVTTEATIHARRPDRTDGIDAVAWS